MTTIVFRVAMTFDAKTFLSHIAIILAALSSTLYEVYHTLTSHKD